MKYEKYEKDIHRMFISKNETTIDLYCYNEKMANEVFQILAQLQDKSYSYEELENILEMVKFGVLAFKEAEIKKLSF